MNITNERIKREENFIQERQIELAKKMEEYNKYGLEIVEYKRIIQFCQRYLYNTERKKKVLVGITSDIFTRAAVTNESKILIRLYEDIFVEMSHDKAIQYSQKRIEYLKILSKRVRNECHFLQSQLNILLLGLDVLLNKTTF